MSYSKVLIVDDEAINNKLIKRLLSSFHIDSKSTTDSTTIFKLIEEERPDLILLDLLMPVQDGFTTLCLLKESPYKDIPVIILSGEKSEVSLLKCLESGAIDYLTKPVRKLELRARIESALRFNRLNQELSSKVFELQKAYEIIERELEIAKKIQLSSIGNPDFETDYVTISSRLEIANKLGGDFYDIKVCDNDVVLGTIADVSGHGVSSSLVVMMLKSQLDALATGFWTPAELLDMLHENFYGKIPKGYYIALTHFIYKPDTNTLTYCVAGLYDLIIIRKGTNELEFAGSRNFAVGFIENITFTEKSIQLFEGDKVILYTDGINEVSNEQGEMYSRERLHQLLKNYADLSSAELRRKIFEERNIFIGETIPEDDTTLMILEIKK